MTGEPLEPQLDPAVDTDVEARVTGTAPLKPDALSDAPEPLPAQAPVEKWPFWGYGDLALLIGCFFGSFVLVGLLFGVAAVALPEVKKNLVTLSLVAQVVLYGLAYLSLYFTLKSRYGRPLLRSLGWKVPRQGLLIPAVAGIVLPFAVSVLVTPFHPPKIDSPFDKFAASPATLVFFGIVAAILAPAIEELVFRGFLQPLLSKTFGVVAGVLATALLFGALHLPEYSNAWQYAAAVTLAGIAFGAMRAWTDSTLASAIMHGGFNLVTVVALFAREGKH